MTEREQPKSLPKEQSAAPGSDDKPPTDGAKQTGGPFGKLFVGQVPAVCTEEMLTPLFQPYGTLLEIKIMRDSHGRSKGCAWVRYETQAQAQAAIEALHEKHTIPPQTNMLQVRYAQSRSGAGQGGGGGGADAAGTSGSGGAPGARGGNAGGAQRRAGGEGGNGNAVSSATNGGSATNLRHANPAGVGLPTVGGMPFLPPFGGQFPGFNPYGMMYPAPMAAWGNPLMAASAFGWGGMAQGAGFDQYAWPPASGGGGAGPKLKRSPPGSSCFVGNLPSHLTSVDLKALFQAQLGSASIVQVSIHRDKRFGFVTFSTPEDATAASQKLNGFTVGENKIRVEVTQNEPKHTNPSAGPNVSK